MKDGTRLRTEGNCTVKAYSHLIHCSPKNIKQCRFITLSSVQFRRKFYEVFGHVVYFTVQIFLHFSGVHGMVEISFLLNVAIDSKGKRICLKKFITKTTLFPSRIMYEITVRMLLYV